MTTKTALRAALDDETEQMFHNAKCVKAPDLVWQAAFGATWEAAAKRGLGCADIDETLKTAALDQIRPSTLLPYDDALASAECFQLHAAIYGHGAHLGMDH